VRDELPDLWNGWNIVSASKARTLSHGHLKLRHGDRNHDGRAPHSDVSKEEADATNRNWRVDAHLVAHGMRNAADDKKVHHCCQKLVISFVVRLVLVVKRAASTFYAPLAYQKDNHTLP